MKRYLLLGLLISAFVVVFVFSALAAPVKQKVMVKQPSRVAAHPASFTVPVGTDVPLIFDQSLSSKTAKVGDVVRLHVSRNILVHGYTILRSRTPVTGVISRVDKRKHYGVNANLRIALNPVRSLYGAMIPLQPRTQGKSVAGEKSGKAAAATIGGAAVLGPVGLVGGYFVMGKPVTIKAGDQFITEVAKTTIIPLRTMAQRPQPKKVVVKPLPRSAKHKVG